MTDPADLRARVQSLLDAKEMAANDAAVRFVDAALATQAPALLSRIDALTEALEPFAERAREINPVTDDAEWLDSEELGTFQAGHFRAVLAALDG